MLASDDSIVEEVGGIYSYYCFVLADFDPIRARQLEAESNISDVTKAIMAKYKFNKPKDD